MISTACWLSFSSGASPGTLLDDIVAEEGLAADFKRSRKMDNLSFSRGRQSRSRCPLSNLRQVPANRKGAEEGLLEGGDQHVWLAAPTTGSVLWTITTISPCERQPWLGNGVVGLNIQTIRPSPRPRHFSCCLRRRLPRQIPKISVPDGYPRFSNDIQVGTRNVRLADAGLLTARRENRTRAGYCSRYCPNGPVAKLISDDLHRTCRY
jgi:hypothetical protein